MEPQQRIGLAALTRFAFSGGDLTPLRTDLLTKCANGTASAGALMDLSVIDQILGNQDLGLQWQESALTFSRTYETIGNTSAQKTILVFAQAFHMGSNTPIEFLLADSAYKIVTYYPQIGDKSADLPPHDIAFCAAPADAVYADAFFQTVRDLTRKSDVPVLNLPDNLVKPERDILPPLFSHVQGLHVPRTVRISRNDMCDFVNTGDAAGRLAHVGTYPFIVRPIGSHAGQGLAKVHSPKEFQDYLQTQNAGHFFVSEFVNYASDTDGQFRKYRIVLVDGKAFPCHMAISSQWDVWYMNAGMRESEAKKREEADFMFGFEEFNARHQNALNALADGIGLDYFGVDCAEDANGNLVVFEVDNALIVHDMDSEIEFPYKKAHMQSIFDAFETMLSRRDFPLQKDSSPTAILPGASLARDAFATA